MMQCACVCLLECVRVSRQDAVCVCVSVLECVCACVLLMDSDTGLVYNEISKPPSHSSIPSEARLIGRASFVIFYSAAAMLLAELSCLLTHTHTHTASCLLTRTHSNKHAHHHVCSHAHTLTNTHTIMSAHTCVHTHTHTHSHTHRSLCNSTERVCLSVVFNQHTLYELISV